MVKYLLDTNICIYLMKEQPESVTERFDKCEPGEIAVSAVTWAELCVGIGAHSDRAVMDELFNKLIPQDFGIKAAFIFGELSRKFPNRKINFDRMIAAHAMALDVTLVTNNTADFDIYQGSGLKLENWVKSRGRIQ
ncbi:MAG: type II toxin-antitoxin system VapC family toxin [Desulfovibrionaceae bacterium]|jgi:tRNA(fMet)-specific endonuclease VapC|nr:type II toxin-antitoxin system VapC family toxin [Desulfovibrionaceae bacterium]